MPANTKPHALRGDQAQRWREQQGNYIRGLREHLQMTGTDLADAVGGMNKQAISHIETGRINLPIERLTEFSEALGVPISEFATKILRWQNPWLYAAIIGSDAELTEELENTPDRVNPTDRKKPKPKR